MNYILVKAQLAGDAEYTDCIFAEGDPSTPTRVPDMTLNNQMFWFGLVWFYGISTVVGYLMPNPFLYRSTVLFQTIQFSISRLFSSIWSIDKTLSGATTLGQSEPGSDGNEEVLSISQSSSITGASSSDCLVSSPGQSLGESYSSVGMQSGNSVAPADLTHDLRVRLQ